MEKIIEILETKGMSFTEKNDTHQSAELYLRYNTCWQLLKQSRNLLYLQESKENLYSGLSFFQIRTAGLVHFYFNNAFSGMIREFEHGLKVYMSDVYCQATELEKEKIFDQWQHIQFRHNEGNVILNKENIFVFYTYGTLAELLSAYKVMKRKITSIETIAIDPKINKIRNAFYHHNNLLIENTRNRNSQPDLQRLDFITKNPTSKELEYLQLNYKYNTLRLLLETLENTNFFLSRDDSTSKRRVKMNSELRENIEKAKKYYSKLEKKEWIDITFSILDKVI